MRLPMSERLERLAERRIGLWDVIASASRRGSLDQAIRARRAQSHRASAPRFPRSRGDRVQRRDRRGRRPQADRRPPPRHRADRPAVVQRGATPGPSRKRPQAGPCSAILRPDLAPCANAPNVAR